VNAIEYVKYFASHPIPKVVKRAILAKIRQGVPPEQARDEVAEGMALSGYNLDGTPIEKQKESGPKPPPYKGKDGYNGPTPPPYKGKGGYSGPKPPPYKNKGEYTGPKPPPYKGKQFSTTQSNMNTLKQQIVDTRNYLYQNKMYSELEGFDTAIRMFADANKKSFKDKAAEVWKKHKGKILAGAAAAAAAAAGTYGYGKYKEKQALKNIANAPANAVKEAKEALVQKILECMRERNSSSWKSVVYALPDKVNETRFPEAYAEAKARFQKEKFENAIPKDMKVIPGPKVS
jgi:hypothetical protein